MAPGAPPTDDAADLLKNLSLDSQTKSSEVTDTVKKPSVGTGNGRIGPKSKAAQAYYPNGYPLTTYYCGGYNGATSDWDAYSTYMNLDTLDLAYGVYGYGYAPYGYGYSPYFQPSTPTSGPYSATVSPTKGEKTASVITDQPSVPTDTAKGSAGNGAGSKGSTGSAPVRPTPYPVSGMSRLYPNKLYSQYENTYRYGYGYGANAYGVQTNGRGWPTVDNKARSRLRGNGFYGYNDEYSDGLNELNRGPRTRATKNQNITFLPTDDVKELKEDKVTPDREQYNKADFCETYADAKFFIIKSYSEDDVHKSIKYNMWASTPNGNKKLDAAYHEAQQKSDGCPVFLFFSVNTSGQFVGVAEMVGPVDFDRSLEYWQQDKWVGCFPVKWHIVKDLPNSLLKHIILEYNENKPVTNSRDTQEVKLMQGLQMIKIFKEHSSKQCILDDFEFYEDRQKKIQQKKAKQQQFQKQSWEEKLVTGKKIKEGIEGEVLKTVGVVLDLANEVKTVDDVQDNAAKPAEMNVVVNGVANAC